MTEDQRELLCSLIRERDNLYVLSFASRDRDSWIEKINENWMKIQHLIVRIMEQS